MLACLDGFCSGLLVSLLLGCSWPLLPALAVFQTFLLSWLVCPQQAPVSVKFSFQIGRCLQDDDCSQTSSNTLQTLEKKNGGLTPSGNASSTKPSYPLRKWPAGLKLQITIVLVVLVPVASNGWAQTWQTSEVCQSLKTNKTTPQNMTLVGCKRVAT